MSILGILIPVSLFLGGIGVIAFLWTLRTDQYDDLEGHAARILQEADHPLAEQSAEDDTPARGDKIPPDGRANDKS